VIIDSSSIRISTLLERDLNSVDVNLELASEYEIIGHTSTAISYYLRSAELSHNNRKDIAYCALLKIASCLESQGGRDHSVTNAYLQALSHQPHRPEGYYLFSRYYERIGSWQESHTMACLGLQFTRTNLDPLALWVQYPGEYGLLFQKAVASWWVGRGEESIQIFNELLHSHVMDEIHTEACLNNLTNLGVLKR
jgi:hypothetical protein